MTEKQDKKTDISKWILALVLFVAALVANYHYPDIVGPLRVFAWIIVFGVIGAILAVTNTGRTVVSFARDSRAEMRKVVWPTRQETTQTTMVVMVLVLIVALFLWLVDSTFLGLIGWLTGQHGA